MKCKNCYAYGYHVRLQEPDHCLLGEDVIQFKSGDIGCYCRTKNIKAAVKNNLVGNGYVLRNVINDVMYLISKNSIKESIALAEEYGISPKDYGILVAEVTGK